MSTLTKLLDAFLWPGTRFCALVGSSPTDDSGMLRGFINSIVWGLVAAMVVLTYL